MTREPVLSAPARPKNPEAIPGGRFESVHAAKLAVMERVPYLQKETAKGLTYSFASESGLIEKLHPAMREAGLTWGPVAVELLESADYQTRHGVVMFRVRVLVVYRLTHAATATHEEYHAIGESSDMGDKGCAKAMTMAQKYALRQAFLIETGDDPDRTPSEEADPHEWQKRKAAHQAQAEREPTAEQREAAAAEAIKLASDEPRLNKLELSIIERTGSAFTPGAASRLLSLVTEQRKRLSAATGGPSPGTALTLPATPSGLVAPAAAGPTADDATGGGQEATDAQRELFNKISGELAKAATESRLDAIAKKAGERAADGKLTARQVEALREIETRVRGTIREAATKKGGPHASAS